MAMALTVCQPYAEMIAAGEKLIENRTWPTAYRGRLYIHAGKSREWLDDGEEREGMAFGAVVAVADLVDCLRVEDVPQNLDDRYLVHANGPWCWLLQNVRRLPQPLPWRGAQGLWSIQVEAM